ncbi:MAG: S53 family peptidase [Candidatus Dormibacterales bacterium]
MVSYGSPTIASDLRVFDHEFGLPAARLTVVEPAGPVPAYDGSDPTRVSAAAETSLDVEWAHAVAPGAALLVVATPTFEGEGTSGFPEIVAAERTVIDRGMADVINESFGATEQTFPAPAAILGMRGAEQDAAGRGVSMVAASGDQGAGGLTRDARGVYPFPAVIWPASDPLVTAIGGTFVDLDGAGRRLEPDSVWQSPPGGGRLGASGGGLSTVFPRPAFQDAVASVVKGRRGIPDISLSAAYEGSVDVYDTAPGGARGWQLLYGTSEAAPLFSGMVAIADQLAGRRLGEVDPLLYRLAAEHEPGIVDVTRGDNSLDFRSPAGAPVAVRGYPSAPGYDLASGLGTAAAALLVPELAGALTAGPSVD